MVSLFIPSAQRLDLVHQTDYIARLSIPELKLLLLSSVNSTFFDMGDQIVNTNLVLTEIVRLS